VTAPNQPTPPSREQIAQHEQIVLAFEVAAIAALTGGMAATVADVVAWLPVEYARLFGTERASGLQFQAMLRQSESRIRRVQPPTPQALLEHARDARAMGVRQGLSEAGMPDEAVAVSLDREPAKATQEAARAAVDNAREKLHTAALLTHTMAEGSSSDVQAAVAPAQHAVTSLERDLTSLLHASVNDGLTAAIDHLDGRPLWVAERDACTLCLPLSGQLADDEGHFDWTLTFGAKAFQPKAYDDHGDLMLIDLLRPPRHPRCRCRVCWWYGDRTPEPHDFPTVLRREAERSILNGYALDSEPTSTRIRAAEQLLGLVAANNSRTPSGWQVPASVRKRASDALHKGRFTTRPVPNGRWHHPAPGWGHQSCPEMGPPPLIPRDGVGGARPCLKPKPLPLTPPRLRRRR
jgi:hypothetical protein